MSREIKFRGIKEETSGEWVYGGYHKPFEDVTQIIEITGYNASQMTLVYEHTIGQFTGLKDKNGKDIYEFDYVVDEFNQRILVDYDFALLSRLKEIQDKIVLDGNFYE